MTASLKEGKETMWKRMAEPWLMAFTLVDMAFSFAMAHLLVRGLGWRYTDWLGLASSPFDASSSILAYAVLGGVLWPVVALVLWLSVSELSDNWSRSQRLS
jgi:hypothetical protein